MPKRLTVPQHLTPTELETRYRGARDPVARSHWQIVWLLASGRPTREVAATTGYSVPWVRQVAHRYAEGGAAAIGDRRHANRGAPPLLSSAQQAELRSVLAGPAPDGGPWTCRKVAAWIGEAIGRPVTEARGWEWMRRLGFPTHRPGPRATRTGDILSATGTRQLAANGR